MMPQDGLIRFRYVSLALLAASLVNVLPAAMYHLGGDAFLHLISIRCFSSQLWQGDPYPRWCFQADGGMGAPLFLFYFPLPYYLAALFYPLHFAGLPLYAFYVLLLWLLTLATGFSAWRWLKEVAGGRVALLCSVFFLFLPYRMEIMLYRSAYAEVACMAALPMLCLSVRRLALSQKRAFLSTLFWMTVCLLCHVPTTFGVLMGLGIYLLIMEKKNFRPLWLFIAAGAVSLILISFYVLPALHYIHYTQAAVRLAKNPPWANRFILLSDWTGGKRVRVLTGFFLSIFVFALLAALAFFRRRRIANSFAAREIAAWIAAGIFALFMAVPLSGPVWDLINALAPVGFPWRMQMLFTLSLIFVGAAYCRWLSSDAAQRRWMGDALLTLGGLALLSYFSLSIVDRESLNRLDTVIQAGLVPFKEYRTQWTDPEHYGYNSVMAHMKKQTRVEILKGDGMARVAGWSWRGIVLQTEARGPMVLRVYQTYFPVWECALDGKPCESSVLSPEQGTGLMRVNLPEGEHVLLLKPKNDWEILEEIFRQAWQKAAARINLLRRGGA